MEIDKDYDLGEGIKANFDGYSLWLRSKDSSFSLALHPEQVSALLKLIEEIDWDDVEEE